MLWSSTQGIDLALRARATEDIWKVHMYVLMPYDDQSSYQSQHYNGGHLIAGALLRGPSTHPEITNLSR